MPYDEQPLRPLDQTEESLVRALAHVMMALPRMVDADMVGDGGLPLSEYTPSCSCPRRPTAGCG
ncbi:hypothetical protein HEP87_58030 [Streptomyces sp. S1D4-11]